jgi:hypothetical protein
MTGPSPDLGPADVVLAQLAAFQREAADAPDDGSGDGMAEAFAFASPGNRAATGPLPRFGQMLRADAYRGLLGHRAAQLGPVHLDGADQGAGPADSQADSARVEVLVVAADDSTQGYTWVLTRQRSGAQAGCWLTDGVVRHPEQGR